MVHGQEDDHASVDASVVDRAVQPVRRGTALDLLLGLEDVRDVVGLLLGLGALLLDISVERVLDLMCEHHLLQVSQSEGHHATASRRGCPLLSGSAGGEQSVALARRQPESTCNKGRSEQERAHRERRGLPEGTDRKQCSSSPHLPYLVPTFAEKKAFGLIAGPIGAHGSVTNVK
eukprot:scaffold5399_cov60-Phaeocystis_antarctica.AAC.2